MSFGAKLQSIRKIEGLSQDELALKIGVSQKTISSWETDRTSPSISDLDKLCNLFGVGMNFFSEIETRVTKPVFAPDPRYWDESDEPDKVPESKKTVMTLAQVLKSVEELSCEDKEALRNMLDYMLK